MLGGGLRARGGVLPTAPPIRPLPPPPTPPPTPRARAVCVRAQAVKESPPWAVDAWGLGCVMQELYSGKPMSKTEDLRNTGGWVGWWVGGWVRWWVCVCRRPAHPGSLLAPLPHALPPTPHPTPHPDCVPPDLLPHYQRLLASAPERRQNPARLLESGVLRSKLVIALAFLDNLAIKDAAEKVGGWGGWVGG